MPSSAAARARVYSLSLHAALPICRRVHSLSMGQGRGAGAYAVQLRRVPCDLHRSEEHTSELQSLRHLVCRLVLRHEHESTLFPYTPLFRSVEEYIRFRWGKAGGQEPTPFSSAAFHAISTDRKSTRLNSSHLGISYAV